MKKYIKNKFNQFENEILTNINNYKDGEVEYYAYYLIYFYKEYEKNIEMGENGKILDQNDFNNFLNKNLSNITEKPYERVIKKIHEWLKNKTTTQLIKKITNKKIEFYNNFNVFYRFLFSDIKSEDVMQVKNNLMGEISGIKNKNSEFNAYRCFLFEGELNKVELDILKSAFDNYFNKDIENPIYNFFYSKLKYKNGLFLNNAPTGSGKSYHTASIMFFGCLFQNLFTLDKKRNIFYITDLKQNLNSVFSCLIERIEKFCRKMQLSDKYKYFLLNRVNLMIGQEDFFKFLKEQLSHSNKDNENSFYPLFEKVFGDLNTLKHQINNAIDNSNSDSKISSHLYNKIRKQFSDNKEILSQSEHYFLSKLFTGETINSDEKTSGYIYLMTTAKAMLPTGRIDSNFVLFAEQRNNDIIFLDEFDKQSKVMLNNLIPIDSFNKRKIIRMICNLTTINFAIDYAHGNDYLEKLKIDFIEQRIRPFAEKFLPNNTMRLIADPGKKSVGIFDTGIGDLFVGDSDYITFKQDKKNNLNIIYIEEEKNVSEETKEKNKISEINILKLNSKMDELITHFVYFIQTAATKYNHQRNGVQSTLKDKIYYLLEEIQMTDLSLLFDIYSVIKLEDDLAPLLRVKIEQITGQEENVVFKSKELKVSPESLLVHSAKNNLIIGISATAENQSKISNFDLKLISDNLGDKFHFMTEEEKEKMSDYFRERQRYIKENINTEIKPIGKIENNPELCLFLNNSSIYQNLAGSDNNSYKKIQFEKLLNACIEFMYKPTGRIMLALSTPLHDSEVTKLLKQVLHKLSPALAEMIRFFPDNEHDNDKEFKANAEFFRKHYGKVGNYLNKNEKYRAIIITSYNTVGAGANLQHKNAFLLDLKNYINIDKKARPFKGIKTRYDYDIDTLFLAEMTNLLTSKVEEDNDLKIDESKGDEKMSNQLKTLFYLNKLYYGGQYSRNEYRDSIKNVKKSNIIDLAKNYKKTNDYKYNVLSIIKQSIGRLERTSIKNIQQSIYIDENLVVKLSGCNFEYEEYDPVSYTLLIDFLNNKKSEINKLKPVKIAGNNAEYFKFKNFKENLLNKAYSNESYRRKWYLLRDFALRYGLFVTEEEKIECVKVFGIDFFIELKKETNSYDYNYTGENFWVDENSERYTINEKTLKLDILKKNRDIVEFFEKNNYTLDFRKNKFTLPANYINDIYKGSIGEICCYWLFKEYFEVEFSDAIRLDGCFFEKADYFIFNKQRIGIDAKNFELLINKPRYNKKVIDKIEQKLNKDEKERLDKIMIINTFLNDEKLSVKYGNIKEGVFYECTDHKVCQVVIINGFICNNGRVADFTQEIYKLMEWLNETRK